MLKLINNQPSPFGRKVVIALKEKELPFDTIWDQPWDDATTVPGYNPLEQLPILITETNEYVYESSYILEWLDRRYPSPKLMPDDDDGILESKRLQVLATGVMGAAMQLTFELHRSHQSEAWKRRQRRKISGGLREISRLIGENDFAVAGKLTVADIEVGVVLGVLEFMGGRDSGDLEEMRWREPYPNLSNYFDQLESRPSFRDSRPHVMNVDISAIVE